MSKRTVHAILLSLGCLSACGHPTSGTDAEATPDAARDGGASDAPIATDVPGGDALVPPDGADTDASTDAETDAGAQADGSDGAACAVSDAGSLQTNYYCDLAMVHVMQHTGGPAGVVVQARVGTGTPSCGAIDGVDIVNAAGTVLARLGASGGVALGSQGARIATGDAPAALVSECANETTRLTSYGLVIHGRDANGPFEARCGSAEDGSRWPPGTALACHQNLDSPPVSTATVQVMGIAGTMHVSFIGALPHDAGHPAASSVDGTVRVVSPQRSTLDGPGAPLVSQDTTGWVGNLSEIDSGGGPVTQLNMDLFVPSVAFNTDLCPASSSTAGAPPWFLARVTGQGPSGAVRAELLASCMTIAGP